MSLEVRHGRLLDVAPAALLGGAYLAQLVPWGDLHLPLTLASDGLIALSFVAGMTRALVTRQLAALGRWPSLIVLAGLVLCVMSAMASPEPLMAIQGLVRLVEIFFLVPTSFLLAVRSRLELVIVLGSLGIMVAVQSLYAVVQMATGTGALIGGEAIRGVGTWGAANIGGVASFSTSCLAMAVGFAIALRGRARLFAAAAAVVFGAGSLAALSRGSWIAGGAACFILATRYGVRRGIKTAVIGGAGFGVLYAIAAASNSPLGDRFMSLVNTSETPDQSVIDRYSLWAAARHMVDMHPVLGVGPMQFQAHRDAYAPLALLGSSDIGSSTSFERQAILSPHNLYLLLSSEYGVPAAGCLLFVVFGSFVLGVVRLRRTPSDKSIAWGVGLAATGCMVSTFFDAMFGDLGGPASLNMAFCIAFSCWWAAHTRRTTAFFLPGPGPIQGVHTTWADRSDPSAFAAWLRRRRGIGVGSGSEPTPAATGGAA